ncbi:MAG: hypothetical protein ACRD0P_06320 [Stackebrandtia sp.]
MSDIEARDETTGIAEAAPAAPTGDLSELAQWAADARQVAAVATSLARTSFVPQQYRERPAEVTAAILAGHEVGMQPIAALRSINVIQGTPSMSAVAMRGLVQSQGHQIRVVEATADRAVVHGRRAALIGNEEEVHESVWTVDRAKQLGLTGKQNWKVQPQAMLVARATAECCRLTAADVLLGIPYATEELDDIEPDETPKPKQRKRHTAKRQPIPEPDLTLHGRPVETAADIATITNEDSGDE